MDKRVYDSYIAILKHELVPALGCTEPIAIAFAAAKARDVLGRFPEHVTAWLSGNMIKNAKSVIVPNSDNDRGIETAVALGCAGGDASLQYEVLKPVTEADIRKARELVRDGFCDTRFVDDKDNLYIRIEATCGEESSTVTVEYEHTNITCIEKNGKVVFSAADSDDPVDGEMDRRLLNVRDIYAFASEVSLDDVRELLERQVSMNTAISDEGLKGYYGAAVGWLLLQVNGDHVEGRAAARAAAGSDARMNGCSMPVVINSGSGNQGMTITLPICEYAQTWGVSHDKMLRALALANLISVHIKRHIGNLSAFCGAVNAGCAAACGIAWMDGCSYEQICMCITNTLCNVGGIVCDGAKSSCAAKIAAAVNAGTFGYRMAKKGLTFRGGDGLAGEDIETTIENIGRMGRDGMHGTDVEILNIMVGQ